MEIASTEHRRYKDPSMMDMLGARETEYMMEDADPDPTVQQESGEEWLHLALLIEEKQYV